MSPLAWPLTFLALAFMYPWARWLLRSASRDRVLVALTTLALSIGTLSLVMLWIGLLGVRIDWRLAAILCAGIGAVGWIILRRDKQRAGHRPAPTDNTGVMAGFAVLVIFIISVLILFNAVYWPFGIADAITIYATFGKQIANTGQLPRGDLYELYPMLVPLGYAFTHQAAGWIDEHLAALIPAALSIGVIGAAYLLGHRLFDRTVGLIAALLIALTPMFTHWASTGYVDLPAAFFYGMVAYFLWRTDTWQDALLAGVMAGLAAWTKNSGLLIVGSIALWVIYRWWLSRSEPHYRLRLLHIGLIVAGFLIVAGPWYMRNLATAGMVMPPTGWTWKAERTAANLLPYLADTRYSLIGWLFTAGLLLALWQFVRKRGVSPTFLLIFYVPFFAIWWMLFSYDGRFLLMLTPIIAVMAAYLVREVMSRVDNRWAGHRPAPTQRLVRVGVVLLVIGLALPAASAAVDYKPELLRNPLMSDADKYRLRLGTDRYEMALYLRTLPAGSRIWTQDLLLPYHADGMDMIVGGWPTAAALQPFDYWVLSPGEALPDWFGEAAPLHTQGGYRLYAIRH